MRQRRRIFRPTSSPWGRVGRVVLPACVGAAGIAALVSTGLSTGLLRSQPPPQTPVAANAADVAVVDGETLRVGSQVVRLAGVDAPGRGERCRGGVDCGGAATAALAGLVRGRRVECVLDGRDLDDRPLATCRSNGVDLSHAIVLSGWARAQSGDAALGTAESTARRAGAGLWAGGGAR